MRSPTFGELAGALGVVEKEDARGDEDEVQISGSLVTVKKRAPEMFVAGREGPENHLSLSQMLEDRDQSHTSTAEKETPEHEKNGFTPGQPTPESPYKGEGGSKAGEDTPDIHRLVLGAN